MCVKNNQEDVKCVFMCVCVCVCVCVNVSTRERAYM